ncbi:unnamed protein product [Protopolystoma xenopodis]|uniref:Uncharacterized protein n=1 Tax=Protopolystoma xenopodis TaxID=117903 RepID=A0A3S5BV10_9PLAT|nr:unnamed protein product [Protopolystoma xenopodis]
MPIAANSSSKPHGLLLTQLSFILSKGVNPLILLSAVSDEFIDGFKGLHHASGEPITIFAPDAAGAHDSQSRLNRYATSQVMLLSTFSVQAQPKKVCRFGYLCV